MTRPFIPRDKPRWWVIFILACLVGLGVGLLAFTAAWFGLTWVSRQLVPISLACWATAAVSWFGFMFGMVTGRYRNLEDRPWKEQVW